ncbi:hypothetical protein [Campylobacter geochelonis]|uniref:hypothetical protein n=1 Tax=Campylobacter geochelonis TaxID=1780362 RepID=UPI000770B643|nr:hypothetical protein [Campylobacter geochelonis]CZE48277.1 JHP0747 family [Campylobacter geochelonis]CZE50052.1 JHP0747 family [Campylobacter geochelonis]
MRVAVDCECKLLQRSLELFLEQYLVGKDECEFVVSDDKNRSYKNVFFIADNSPYLSLPFSKDELILALSKYYYTLLNSSNLSEKKVSLEDKISRICDEFKENIIKTIREHNG